MTSNFFSLNEFLLLEYIYKDLGSPRVIPTSTLGFRKVSNQYDGTNLFLNKNNGKGITDNVVDFSAVPLETKNKYALLDTDSAYFYPNIDPKIVLTDVVIVPPLNVEYETIRIHILAGYNFEGIDGFMLSINLRRNDNKLVKLCDLVYQKSQSDLLYFSSKILRVSEFIYDKYVEFTIPAFDYIISQQRSNLGSTTTLSYYFTEGIGFADQNIIYCDFKILKSSSITNGINYFSIGEEFRFNFNSVDLFDLLLARIVESTNGDYFEYYAEWNGSHIEDYIYRLNSLAGNKYIVIHDLSVKEQIGASFIETKRFSEIQLSNYDSSMLFRPVILNANIATSFSIDYSIRLFNRADGSSVLKTSSLSSLDVNKYGKIIMRLNVGEIDRPQRVYNVVKESPKIVLNQTINQPVLVKYVPTFLTNNNIVVNSASVSVDGSGNVKPFEASGNSILDAIGQDELTIVIDPFDNYFKFDIFQLNNGEVKSIDLGSNSKYHIAFLKDNGDKLQIEESNIGVGINKSEGELLFFIDSKTSPVILRLKSKVFYIISKDLESGFETIVYRGKFSNVKKSVSPKPNISSSPNGGGNIRVVNKKKNFLTDGNLVDEGITTIDSESVLGISTKVGDDLRGKTLKNSPIDKNLFIDRENS